MQCGMIVGHYVFICRIEKQLFPNVVSNRENMCQIHTVSDQYLSLFDLHGRIGLSEYLLRCRYLKSI